MGVSCFFTFFVQLFRLILWHIFDPTMLFWQQDESCLPRSLAGASLQLVRARFLGRLAPPATGRAGRWTKIFWIRKYQILDITAISEILSPLSYTNIRKLMVIQGQYVFDQKYFNV